MLWPPAIAEVWPHVLPVKPSPEPLGPASMTEDTMLAEAVIITRTMVLMVVMMANLISTNCGNCEHKQESVLKGGTGSVKASTAKEHMGLVHHWS